MAERAEASSVKVSTWVGPVVSPGIFGPCPTDWAMPAASGLVTATLTVELPPPINVDATKMPMMSTVVNRVESSQALSVSLTPISRPATMRHPPFTE